MQRHTTLPPAPWLALCLATALACPPAVAQWQTAASLPRGRSNHRTVYDAARDVVVLFGGVENGPDISDKTLEWDGTGWVTRNPAQRPEARYDHQLVYHPGRGTVVLFGGENANSVLLDDMWEWDGTNWTRLQPATVPPARARHAMAYDAARDRIVMYGGSPGTLTSTWEWDGNDWTALQPTHRPSGLGTAAYDEARQRTVYVTATGVWEWDGNDWVEASSAPSPLGAYGWSAVYHGARQRVVAMGGTIPGTWEWDGATWKQLSSFSQPYDGAAAYDAGRRRIVYSGGLVCSPYDCSEVPTTTLYRSPTPALYGGFGTGCPGSAGTPSLGRANASLPWAGDDFDLEITGLATNPPVVPVGILGSSAALWGAVPLPFDLGVLGAPGCLLYTGAELAVPLANVQGRAAWRLSIPAVAGVAGATVYAQGLVLGDPSNSAGIVTTSAGEILLGER